MFREPRQFGTRCTLAAALVVVSVTASATAVAQSPAGTPPSVLFSTPLADAPGKPLVVVELKFAPNPSSLIVSDIPRAIALAARNS